MDIVMDKKSLLDSIAELLCTYPDGFAIKSPVILVHWDSGIALERRKDVDCFKRYQEEWSSYSSMKIDGVDYSYVGKGLWDAWNSCYTYLDEQAQLKTLNKTVNRLYGKKWWQK